MKVDKFLLKIKENDIDLFSFCIKNEINPSFFKYENNEVPHFFELILNKYIANIKESENSFYNLVEAQGFKIYDEKVNINLHDKKLLFNIKIDQSMFSKINFI